MGTRAAMGRAWLAAATVLAGASVGALPAAAQGWVEPGVDRGGFAVDRTRSEVLVRIDGRSAQIEVSEWFVNRGRRLAEGDYLSPLPGEIMDAERARHSYEEIARRCADPVSR